MNKINELMLGLRSRRALLNPGVTKRDPSVSMAPSYEELYRTFDGFVAGYYDERSAIRLLRLREVIESKANYCGDGNGYVIADFLMGSDQYIADLSDHEKPIISLGSGETIAESLFDLLQGIVAGRYDFL